VLERSSDLARRAGASFDLDSMSSDRSGALLAHAYPDRIAVRRSQPGQFQMRSGSGAWTPATDPLADERFVVAADLDGKRENARIRIGAALDTEELITAMADQVERRVAIVWDKTRDDLVERIETRLGGMLLDEQMRAPHPGDATVEALLDRVRTTRLGVLPWDRRTVALRQRVAFLRRTLGDDWPDWTDKALLAHLREWLAPFLQHATGAADLARLDMEMLLTARFDWDTSSRLATLAPPTLITANRRTVHIDYERDVPTASVRVQDLFGTKVHPTVADGRVALALELLSPADRPVQITRDLPGFWSGTWADVRKDMAGRYPKHQWPTDPANAAPTRMK
jgi:ATP-dependent helicase HrpB